MTLILTRRHILPESRKKPLGRVTQFDLMKDIREECLNAKVVVLQTVEGSKVLKSRNSKIGPRELPG